MEKIYEGAISCKALLESGNHIYDTLYIDKKKRTKDTKYLVYLAKSKNINVEFLDRALIDDMASGKTHGGILLKAETRNIENLKDQKLTGYCCYIDGVEDPYNLGSIIRTLYATGANVLLLPKRDWSISEDKILKASAGAFEKLCIYYVENDKSFVNICKKNNIPILCANRKDAKNLSEYIFPNDFCLALGGALRGLSSTITNASDQNIVIDYGRDFKNALDSASATAIFSFEILRQRKHNTL